jgi:hypothetical protein
VALLGFFPLQGFPPHRNGHGHGRASPHEIRSAGDESTTPRPLQGFPTRWDWLASLETADPPEVPPPFDLSRRFDSAAVRESPPQAPGCVAVPSSSHL